MGTHGKIRKVDGCPGNVSCHAGDGVDDEFPCRDENDMDHPCAYDDRGESPRRSGSSAGLVVLERRTFSVDPFCVDVGVCSLIERHFVGAVHMFDFEKAATATASLVDGVVVAVAGV
jgi:hypothetical protein